MYCFRKIKSKREKSGKKLAFFPPNKLSLWTVSVSAKLHWFLIIEHGPVNAKEGRANSITWEYWKQPSFLALRWYLNMCTHSFMEQLVLTWLDDNLVWNDPVKFSHWGRSCSRTSHVVPLLSPPLQGRGWLEAHLYHVHHSLQWDQVTWTDLERKKATITVKIHHSYFQAIKETKIIWKSKVFCFGFLKTFQILVLWPNAGTKTTQVLKFFMAQAYRSW